MRGYEILEYFHNNFTSVESIRFMEAPLLLAIHPWACETLALSSVIFKLSHLKIIIASTFSY